MQTQSERVSRERKSQMCFRRFSTWMFELEISTIRARREKRVCVLSAMGGYPFGARLRSAFS